jgi:hypothetical protein
MFAIWTVTFQTKWAVFVLHRPSLPINISRSEGRKPRLSQVSKPNVCSSNTSSLQITRSVALITSASGRSCSLRAGAAPRRVELWRGWFANFNSRVKASQLTGRERNVTLYQFCQFVKNVQCFPLSGQIYVAFARTVTIVGYHITWRLHTVLPIQCGHRGRRT